MADRAVIFVDGNNWYHSMKGAGVVTPGILDYRRIAGKLLGPRTLVGLRWYVGRVSQSPGSAVLYAEQRRYLAQLEAQDSRISVHYGRLEPRRRKNDAAAELLGYLGSLSSRIDPSIRNDLFAIARRHANVEVYVEKAVDVMLAVDMVAMAIRGEYDAAYLLSADGDYTHAVQEVVRLGKKVYGVSPGPAAQLGAVCTKFIKIDEPWFHGCYLAARP